MDKEQNELCPCCCTELQAMGKYTRDMQIIELYNCTKCEIYITKDAINILDNYQIAGIIKVATLEEQIERLQESLAEMVELAEQYNKFMYGSDIPVGNEEQINKAKALLKENEK